jgi:protein-L-isoaspartate(D-aspartate) O-methyltransferase
MVSGDSYKHQGLRKKLVEEVRRKGINDERVLEAIGRVPRHLFMDSSFIKFAYRDNAFPIASGQTISQPYTVAFQTQLLEVEEGMKVLEVGTGSGYQAAVLVEMGLSVYTIERIKSLFVESQLRLKELGYHAHFFYGDGYEGNMSYGPYDRILVTAGAREIPEKLKDQLKIGGIMVIPVGRSGHQDMIRCQRTGTDQYKITRHGGFVFVPLLKGRRES